MRESTDLGHEQPSLTVALVLVLLYGVPIAPPGTRALALQLDGKDREAVQKDDEVDSLAFPVVDLIHDRKNVLVIEALGDRVEAGGRARVHEAELNTGIERHSVPDDPHEATLGNLVADLGKHGLAPATVVDGVQATHRLGLRLIEKVEQKF